MSYSRGREEANMTKHIKKSTNRPDHAVSYMIGYAVSILHLGKQALKAGRSTEISMWYYRILRDLAMTKRKLLQEPLKKEVMVA